MTHSNQTHHRPFFIRLIRFALFALLGIALVSVPAYFWLSHQLKAIDPAPAYSGSNPDFMPQTPDFSSEQREPCASYNSLREPFFGELHVHTALSYDSYAFGNVAGPDDAYNFARGNPLPMRLTTDKDGDQPPIAQLDRPLDFVAVTEHAENLGEVNICQTPELHGFDAMLCKVYRGDIPLPFNDDMKTLAQMVTFKLVGARNRSSQICGADGSGCQNASDSVWSSIQAAAERAYDRTSDCQFTSFVGFEYSLVEEASNLHRNVIFANSTVPQALISGVDSPNPEQLWQWLADFCIDTESGCNALAIPHNSNWSTGRMFYPLSSSDKPLAEQRRLAKLRNRIEPLVEVMQVKGDSECRNNLSGVLGGIDELCDFEKLRAADEAAEDCGDEYGSGGMTNTGCMSRYSYARYALTEGLAEEQKLGTNPFKFGLVAATDNHTATPSAVREDAYLGSTGRDVTAEQRLMLGELTVPGGSVKANPSRFNPGGIAGVWAEENTRESLFSAMQRRETFGTSGPRITPRFFAGWDFDDNLCESHDAVATAYAEGVPMGGDLPTSTTAKQPHFLVSALADSAAYATDLQKIQIIKGWVDDTGQLHQKIFDVAGDSESQASVNPNTCEQTGPGHKQLCGVWQDPEFDPLRASVYYSRVVENPSCRWSAVDCSKVDNPQSYPVCRDTRLPRTIQERAWTSPIWYQPDALN